MEVLGLQASLIPQISGNFEVSVGTFHITYSICGLKVNWNQTPLLNNWLHFINVSANSSWLTWPFTVIFMREYYMLCFVRVNGEPPPLLYDTYKLFCNQWLLYHQRMPARTNRSKEARFPIKAFWRWLYLFLPFLLVGCPRISTCKYVFPLQSYFESDLCSQT